jgi:serine protease Do
MKKAQWPTYLAPMAGSGILRSFSILILGIALIPTTTRAQSQRFVIDDDEYVDKVVGASTKLRGAHKLVSLDALRRQLRLKGCAVKLAPCSSHKLSPPDLCDRLRESTLAVGAFYKCPDCGGWHFNGSAGFVVGEGGVICTCCHVVLGEDPDVKEGYLVAADSAGRVFPVQSVLAADRDADTCFVKIGANLKPLPLRMGVRVGEPVFCMSHPGGYYFMFTQGMVSRWNSRRDDAVDDHGQTNGLLTRPILSLNVTAEFAPGSSGAPMVDDAGNVVGQVASIADAGESDAGDTNSPASPSVPMRFCTAAEEILRLTDPALAEKSPTRHTKGHLDDSGASAESSKHPAQSDAVSTRR